MYIEGFVPDHVQQVTIVGMHSDVAKCGVNVYFFQRSSRMYLTVSCILMYESERSDFI